MKIKVIFGLVLLALGASAYAYHNHLWQKVSEFRGQNGKTICQWECIGGHFATTSGYGYCGRPN
jgi:hypothetical protein